MNNDILHHCCGRKPFIDYKENEEKPKTEPYSVINIKAFTKHNQTL